jgi:ferrous iron transport protein B
MPDTARNSRTIVLVGNPNVGKSVIFSQITGKYAMVSNYPGTTVEITRCQLRVDGQPYEIIDTPGVNSLVPQSEDEKVTRDIILASRPDLIIQIGDAKNLRRTLFLTLQLAEFGIPMILNLNMIDDCRSRGIEIDTAGITEWLGIPINTTIATMGVGIHQLLRLIPQAAAPKHPGGFDLPVLEQARALFPPPVPPALGVEWLLNAGVADIGAIHAVTPPGQLARLSRLVEDAGRETGPNLRTYFDGVRNRLLDAWLPRLKTQNHVSRSDRPGLLGYPAGLALLGAGTAVHIAHWILPLAGVPTPVEWIGQLLDAFAPAGGAATSWRGWLVSTADGPGLLVGEFGLIHPLLTILLLQLAPALLPLFYLLKKQPRFALDLDRYARRPVTGLGILAGCLSLTYVFVGVIGAQVLVGFMEARIFGEILTPPLAHLVGLIPSPFVQDLLVGEYGLWSMGLTYAVAIVLPIVGAFFIAFGFLEDSGYLPRLAILVNQAFRRIGLNGKAVLPMVLGLGCGTMATMTARILNSPKERLIATLLLALGIPCSAQLGVILGVIAGVSVLVPLLLVLVVAGQLLLVGFLASRILPGENSDFILELPPIRYPVWKNIRLKTRLRVIWFLLEAAPLFLLGTLILFILDRLAWLQGLIAAARPVVEHFLGLPPDAAKVFIMGLLRRDYGAVGLFDMVQHDALTANQLAVALVVLTLFVPCVANVFVIFKEQGLKRAVAIVGFVIPFAVLTGGLVHWLLGLLHITL